MPALIRRRTLKSGKVAYLVQVPLADGRTIRETFELEKDARKRVGKLIEQRDHGEAVKASSETLDAYLDRWLAAARHELRENTFASYDAMLRQYIRPALGKARLSRLTRPLIQTTYDAMREAGLSPRTIRYAHSILHHALDDAVEDHRLARNPSDGVSLPRHQKIEMRPMDRVEVRGFIAVVDAEDDALDARRPIAKAKSPDAEGVRIAAPMAALFHVLVSTGLRPSEAFALKWDDVRLDPDEQNQGAITVKKSLTRTSDGAWVLNEPKTSSSRRTVLIPPQTVAALRRHRVRQAEHRLRVGLFWREQQFIFTNAFGNPLEIKDTVRRHFKPALRQLAANLHPDLPDGTTSTEIKAARADVMRTRLYDLRHTFATLALEAGVNVKTVSAALGHKSIVITLDTYAHVLPAQQREAAALLGSAIYGPG